MIASGGNRNPVTAKMTGRDSERHSSTKHGNRCSRRRTQQSRYQRTATRTTSAKIGTPAKLDFGAGTRTSGRRIASACRDVSSIDATDRLPAPDRNGYRPRARGRARRWRLDSSSRRARSAVPCLLVEGSVRSAALGRRAAPRRRHASAAGQSVSWPRVAAPSASPRPRSPQPGPLPGPARTS
jgi:hypothetical protein